jgi:hypothetical protein
MENNENQEVSNLSSDGVKQPAKPSTSNDEKAPDSSDNTTQQRPKVFKVKKRKKPKDSTAPRHPLTGYVRYLNDQREAVRAANPNLSFSEITKILANEWTNLLVDKKQQYLDAAEQDRVRYTREYNAYKQTEVYKLFMQQQNEKKLKNVVQGQPVITKEIPDMDFGNFDTNIYKEVSRPQ